MKDGTREGENLGKIVRVALQCVRKTSHWGTASGGGDQEGPPRYRTAIESGQADSLHWGPIFAFCLVTPHRSGSNVAVSQHIPSTAQTTRKLDSPNRVQLGTKLVGSGSTTSSMRLVVQLIICPVRATRYLL